MYIHKQLTFTKFSARAIFRSSVGHFIHNGANELTRPA